MNSLILIFALQSERHKKKDKEQQNENQSKTKKQTKNNNKKKNKKKNGENLYKCQSIIKFTSISLIWIREIMQIVVFHLIFFGIFEVLLYIAGKICCIVCYWFFKTDGSTLYFFLAFSQILLNSIITF